MEATQVDVWLLWVHLRMARREGRRVLFGGLLCFALNGNGWADRPWLKTTRHDLLTDPGRRPRAPSAAWVNRICTALLYAFVII